MRALPTCSPPVGSALARRTPVRTGLGAALGLALLCGSTATAWADPSPIASLPAVSITTAGIAPADTATIPGSVAATVDPVAAVPAKPVAHRARRLHVQTVDTASLSEPASAGLATNGLVGNNLIGHARVIEARATTLRPAPLPDQDVDAPGPDAQALAAQQEASVAPSFYGNKDHFSGDGFSEGSNLESDKNNRRKPGGGMSLSIPVQ